MSQCRSLLTCSTNQAELLVKFGLQFGAMVALDHQYGDKLLIVMSTLYGRPDGKPGYCVYAGAAIKQEK